jgi:predicted O-methyltransferase YrrM
MKLTKQLQLALNASRSVLLGANLASARLLLNPRRFVAYANDALFQYRIAAGRRLPQKTVFEVFPAPAADVRLADPPGYTWLRDESAPFAIDLISLCLLCRAVRPKVVFEIGTFVGYTSLHMALNTPEESEIFTLDLPPTERGTALHTTATDQKLIGHEVDRPLFEGVAEGEKVKRLYGDSATFDYSPWHGKVDLFFIDGAHSYEYVKSDTLNALRCTRPGSVIVWHDYGRIEQDGVIRWLHEFARDREVFSVPNGSLAFHVVPGAR